jgi:hypothetical protein
MAASQFPAVEEVVDQMEVLLQPEATVQQAQRKEMAATVREVLVVGLEAVEVRQREQGVEARAVVRQELLAVLLR